MWRLGLSFRRQLPVPRLLPSSSSSSSASYGFIPKLIEHTWSGKPDYDDLLKNQVLFISPPVRFKYWSIDTVVEPDPEQRFYPSLLRPPFPRFYPEPPSLPIIPHNIMSPRFYPSLLSPPFPRFYPEPPSLPLIPHNIMSPRFYPSLLRIPRTLPFPSFYQQLLDRDTFLSPDEAKELGLLDEVIERPPIALAADAVAGNSGGSSNNSEEPSGGGGKE